MTSNIGIRFKPICRFEGNYVKYIYSISWKERPGRSFKSRHSRGHSFEGGGAHLKISVFGGGGSFDRETAVILEAELKKWKELFSHFDFIVENIQLNIYYQGGGGGGAHSRRALIREGALFRRNTVYNFWKIYIFNNLYNNLLHITLPPKNNLDFEMLIPLQTN